MTSIRTFNFWMRLMLALGLGVILYFMLCEAVHGQSTVINSMTISQAVIGPDGSNYVAGQAIKTWTNQTPPMPQSTTVKRYKTATVTKQATQLSSVRVAAPITQPTWTITWYCIGATNHYGFSTNAAGPFTEILVTNTPTQTITLPRTGTTGFIRSWTEWAGNSPAAGFSITNSTQ